VVVGGSLLFDAAGLVVSTPFPRCFSGTDHLSELSRLIFRPLNRSKQLKRGSKVRNAEGKYWIGLKSARLQYPFS